MTRSPSDEEELLRSAYAGASRLEPESRVSKKRAAPTAAKAEAIRATTGLRVETTAGPLRLVEAIAPGVDRSVLRRLADGALAPERVLDLHRLHLADAERQVTRLVRDGRRSGLRAVRIVTGRGRHSEAGTVLKDAVIRWLAGPLAGDLLAFRSAPPEGGGAGAIDVALRNPA